MPNLFSLFLKMLVAQAQGKDDDFPFPLFFGDDRWQYLWQMTVLMTDDSKTQKRYLTRTTMLARSWVGSFFTTNCVWRPCTARRKEVCIPLRNTKQSLKSQVKVKHTHTHTHNQTRNTSVLFFCSQTHTHTHTHTHTNTKHAVFFFFNFNFFIIFFPFINHYRSHLFLSLSLSLSLSLLAAPLLCHDAWQISHQLVCNLCLLLRSRVGTFERRTRMLNNCSLSDNGT